MVPMLTKQRSFLASSALWESEKWWQWSFGSFPSAFSVPCFLAGLIVPRYWNKSLGGCSGIHVPSQVNSLLDTEIYSDLRWFWCTLPFFPSFDTV